MYASRKILKYALYGSVAVGTIISLRGNQNKIEDVGFIRFGRAAFAVNNLSFYIYIKAILRLQIFYFCFLFLVSSLNCTCDCLSNKNCILGG